MLNYGYHVTEVSFMLIVLSTALIEGVLQLFLLSENYDCCEILEFTIK
jgi:hypothetical protein